MFSRLTAFAASLAIVASASFAFTASAHQAPAAGAKPVRTIVLDTVVVTGKRLPAVPTR